MSVKIDPKTFCLAPWVHTCVTTKKTLKPCCVFKIQSNNTYENFDDWWTGNQMANLRKDLVNGNQPAGCEECWTSESLGRDSLRQNYNNIFKSYTNFTELQANIKNENYHKVSKPITWELDIGNLCNLKCIMCDPSRSDKIQDEVLESVNVFKEFPLLIKQATSYTQKNWVESQSGQQLLDHIKNDVKWLKIQGGEALTIKQVRNLIEGLNPADVTLALTTNGTILDKRLLNILKQFKKVEISISVEAAGEENNIIRYGSDWSTIKQNILQLNKLNNVVLQINHVLQITSSLFLPRVLTFAEENNLHLAIIPLNNPEYLHISATPPGLTSIMLEKLKLISVSHPKNISIVKYVTEFVTINKFNLDRYKLFATYVEKLDSIRDKKLSQICKPILERHP